MKIAFWPVDKGRLMGFLDPILFPPLPGCIKALQGKPVRVDALVTSVASLAFLVFFDLLPEGGGVFAVLGFDHLDFFGGRGKRVAGDILGNPGPAQDGGCIETVGRYLEHASHGEQATARNLGLEGDLAQVLAIYAGYSVMLSEALVEKGKVGVDQASDRQVFPEQVIEVGFRFKGEVVIQKIIVEGVEFEGRGNLVERA